jgi:hypothetical protein
VVGGQWIEGQSGIPRNLWRLNSKTDAPPKNFPVPNRSCARYDDYPLTTIHGFPMGRELLCTVRSGGKTASGKALLETNEIVFRGDFRLKIPLASLKSVSAHDGELHLRWPEGTAIFEIGEHAEKWAQKILHPKSTTEKLGIKPGLTVSLIGDFENGFVEDLKNAAERFSQSKAIKNSDLIFFAAVRETELGRATKLAASLSSAGALWIVYPKGRQEIAERQVLEAGKMAGLVDVKVVSFSATHTALKFVRPKAKR